MSASDPLIEAQGLTVTFGADAPVVAGIDFHIARGEALALVGESGSGKSVTARSLVGLAGERSVVTATTLDFDGSSLLRLKPRQWRQIRGSRVGFILQDALVSLDPLRPVGREIAETLKVHTPLTAAERDARVIELLGRVGVPNPELRARQLPSELSGGLRQRALIAAGIAADPELLIADEPTTALDVTVQAQILELLADLKTKGRSILVISHDLAVVSSVADRVAVLRSGEIVESGATRAIFESPRHPYTRALLDAVPAEHAKGTRLSASTARDNTAPKRPPIGEIIVSADRLSKAFTGPDGVARAAVQDVSFELRAGETLGIVGESGSGKTTTGRIVLGLTAPDSGTVSILGREWVGLSAREERTLRQQVQIIYQDPLSAFDPRYTVGRVLDEALRVAGVRRGSERMRAAAELLDQVGLPGTAVRRRPAELSGGQRQRVALARALAPAPRIILLDEPVSALDVSIQAQVLDLLADVQVRTGVAYLFISHDLGVVYHVSDRVVVMKDGEIVEAGAVEQVFHSPSHHYTRELINAIPRLETVPVSTAAGTVLERKSA
ncbi:dipeptide ABC transporter ATP-binding protein [Rathayibacter sp. CAU 1779]